MILNIVGALHDFFIDETDADNGFALDLTDANNELLDQYAEAKIKQAVALAQANAKYNLDIFNGVNEQTASDTLVASRAEANRVLLRDQAEADYDWKIWVSLAQNSLTKDMATAAKSHDDKVDLAAKDHDDGMVDEEKNLSQDLDANLAARETEAVTDSNNLNTQLNQAFADLVAGDYAAMSNAAAFIAALVNNDWTAYTVSNADAEETWWGSVTTDFMQMVSGNNTIYSTFSNAVSGLLDTAAQTIENAVELLGKSLNQALYDYRTAITNYFKTYTFAMADAVEAYYDSIALADYNYEIAMAQAIKNLAIGMDDEENAFGEVEYDYASDSAAETRDNDILAAKRQFLIDQALALLGYNNNVVQEDVDYISETSIDQQQYVQTSAQAEFNLATAEADHAQTYADGVAANEHSFEQTASSSYHSTLVTEYGATPNIREQLDIDIADASHDWNVANSDGYLDLIEDANQSQHDFTDAVSTAIQTDDNNIINAWKDRINDAYAALQTFINDAGDNLLTKAQNHQATGDAPPAMPSMNVSLPGITETVPGSMFDDDPAASSMAPDPSTTQTPIEHSGNPNDDQYQRQTGTTFDSHVMRKNQEGNGEHKDSQVTVDEIITAIDKNGKSSHTSDVNDVSNVATGNASAHVTFAQNGATLVAIENGQFEPTLTPLSGKDPDKPHTPGHLYFDELPKEAIDAIIEFYDLLISNSYAHISFLEYNVLPISLFGPGEEVSLDPEKFARFFRQKFNALTEVELSVEQWKKLLKDIAETTVEINKQRVFKDWNKRYDDAVAQIDENFANFSWLDFTWGVVQGIFVDGLGGDGELVYW